VNERERWAATAAIQGTAMHATAMSCPKLDNEPQHRYRHALPVLTDAQERAERAERRLRSRLIELTWPAALAGIAGGFGAIVGLRLAGL
jgi:hypothetical protein